jgi:hypothetical protein
MRLADDRQKHPLCLMGALGDYSTLLLRWVVDPTSLLRVPGRPQTLLGCEFWVSSRYLLCGVSFPGSGIGAVGVDERVEGASGRPTWFVLLDVDQVEQAAQVCPLVETHLSVARFDHPNQAAHEVEAVRTIITLAVSRSVNLHGDWLVHAFAPRRKGPAGTEGGKVPAESLRLARP